MRGHPSSHFRKNFQSSTSSIDIFRNIKIITKLYWIFPNFEEKFEIFVFLNPSQVFSFHSDEVYILAIPIICKLGCIFKKKIISKILRMTSGNLETNFSGKLISWALFWYIVCIFTIKKKLTFTEVSWPQMTLKVHYL